MRRIKFKELKKIGVLSFAAVLLFATPVNAVQTWGDVKSQVTTNPGNITIENDVTTDGTALNLGAPPVPGMSVNINGGGHTITANPTGDPKNNPSFIINNTPNSVTNIVNTNFTGGNAESGGGAIQNTATITIKGTPENKSSFTNNTAGNGGAIHNSGTGVVVLENTHFENNKAEFTGVDDNKGFGGAIYNSSTAAGSSLDIKASSFVKNHAQNYGGAVANMNGTANIASSYFSENTAKTEGGAILNRASMTIDGSVFEKNSAERNGGAIINGLSNSAAAQQNANLTISNTLFDNNYAVTAGGAIINTGNSSDFVNTLTINGGTTFKNNGYMIDPVTGQKMTSSGGAIVNNGKASNDPGYTDGVLVINGSPNSRVQFVNNVAAGRGGAITNYGKATINNADFIGNGQNEALSAGTKTTNGGAIYNESTNAGVDGRTQGSLTVSNSNFVNNVASSGGAVYNRNGQVTLIDSNFSGNKANSNAAGGAVYGGAGSTTKFIAQNGNVTIGDVNSLANGTDSIALVGSKDAGTGVVTKATGEFLASAGRTINVNSSIIGSKSGNDLLADVNVNKAGADGTNYAGNIRIAGDAKIQNANVNLYDGMLSFDHDKNLDASNILNLYGGTLNLLNNEFGAYQLQTKEFNLLGNSNIMLDVDLKEQKMDGIFSSNFGSITNDGGFNLNVSSMKSVTEAIGNSAKVLFTDAPELIGHVTNNGAGMIEAPINKYSVSQITQSAPGATDNGEYFVFTKMGNSDSILAGPVAAQGAFLLMDNLYRQSFANMDMVTLMTPEQRMAWKMRNKHASLYHTGVYAPYVIPEERDGLYVRPFTNLENVPLQNGPKVSNVSYGTLIGGDSDLVELGRGWDGNFSFFGAYSGSHQTYNGISIWQNAGTFGGVATAYKGNFWTGVTANVGASAAEAMTNFGSEQFPILMTGAAWKSGYNWGLLKNKLIIQPNYMMSYTFVNVFDYRNASGVNITQDPLNAMEIIPGLRIIGNLKNGWQPYLGVSMTWNIMDNTKFYANETALTQLAIKPYFEYGVGLQKRYGNRFTGFGQCMIRNGGRNGVALTMGLRWALGH